MPGARLHAKWLEAREADLLPVGYFHVVFTLPAEIAEIAAQNKAVVYDLLFRAASQTMLTIAADPHHLGARIGVTAVLHTWGSALTHHPHIHMIVPGGGISLDGQRWVSSRPAFLLPVRVLGALFRGLFLTRLLELHTAGKLQFFGKQTELADATAFRQRVAIVRKKTWVVYAKPPFAGPAAVLAYLSRYTHRVAISNRRLIAMDETRRHIPLQGLPPRRRRTVWHHDAGDGRVHPPVPAARPAHAGSIASAITACSPAAIVVTTLPVSANSLPHHRRLNQTATIEPSDYRPPCPCCGGHMIIIETLMRCSPAPGATWTTAISRENDVVTRHGPIHLQIAALLRSAIPLAPDAAKAGRNVIDRRRKHPDLGKRHAQTRVSDRFARA